MSHTEQLRSLDLFQLLHEFLKNMDENHVNETSYEFLCINLHYRLKEEKEKHNLQFFINTGYILLKIAQKRIQMCCRYWKNFISLGNG